MKTYTVAAIEDFGPGLTEQDALDRVEARLQQGIAYYLEEGIAGERFTTAQVLERTVARRPAPDKALRSLRLDAEVQFA